MALEVLRSADAGIVPPHLGHQHILVIMLIPIHGWSAQSMAVRIAHSQASVQAVDKQVSMDGMPADCPMLAEPAPKDMESPSPAKGLAASQSCQLCVTLAALSCPQTHLLAYARQLPPQAGYANFISADLARQVKPPILESLQHNHVRNKQFFWGCTPRWALSRS